LRATERNWPTQSGSVASTVSVDASAVVYFRVFDAVELVVDTRADLLRLAAGQGPRALAAVTNAPAGQPGRRRTVEA
jgi:hypothetical protein